MRKRSFGRATPAGVRPLSVGMCAALLGGALFTAACGPGRARGEACVEDVLDPGETAVGLTSR